MLKPATIELTGKVYAVRTVCPPLTLEVQLSREDRRKLEKISFGQKVRISIEIANVASVEKG
jgi:hypothetical protein